MLLRWSEWALTTFACPIAWTSAWSGATFSNTDTWPRLGPCFVWPNRRPGRAWTECRRIWTAYSGRWMWVGANIWMVFCWRCLWDDSRRLGLVCCETLPSHFCPMKASRACQLCRRSNPRELPCLCRRIRWSIPPRRQRRFRFLRPIGRPLIVFVVQHFL